MAIKQLSFSAEYNKTSDRLLELLTWLETNAVPKFFSKVELDDAGALCLYDLEGNLIYRWLISGSNISVSLYTNPSVAMNTTSLTANNYGIRYAAMNDNGIILDFTNPAPSPSISYVYTFAALFSLTNENNTGVVASTYGQNNGMPTGYTHRLLSYASGDGTSSSALYAPTVAVLVQNQSGAMINVGFTSCPSTCLAPFYTAGNATTGAARWFPKAYMVLSAPARARDSIATSVGLPFEFTANGINYLTNGYWAIADGEA